MGTALSEMRLTVFAAGVEALAAGAIAVSLLNRRRFLSDAGFVSYTPRTDQYDA